MLGASNLCYVIDTSSLIDICPLPPENEIWHIIEMLQCENRLKVVPAVFDELEDFSLEYPAAIARIKSYRKNLCIKETEQFLKEAARIAEKYPRMSKPRAKLSQERADPYVIAYAKICSSTHSQGCLVVASEGFGRGKIPNACRQEQVGFINLAGMCQLERPNLKVINDNE